MTSDLSFVPADEELWQQYDILAARAFGHPVADVTHLRGHADLRVAIRDGHVVAGGLGLLVGQYFGGRPVPSACLAAGCVAPEERGHRLVAEMIAHRLGVLQEQGAVISTITTVSNGHARTLGWEAPAQVLSWSVPADDLARVFDPGDIVVDHGPTPDASRLQHDIARRWNGPVDRPGWWTTWKQARHDLTTYTFHPPHRPPSGLLTLTTGRSQRHGTTLTVHDFWADNGDTAAAMFAFLSRHGSRAPTIDFFRAALPPHPFLLHNLHRYRPQAHAWHPWMLRILDIPRALQLRGWPPGLDLTIPIDIETDDGTPERHLLQIAAGGADLTPTRTPGHVSLTRRQLAVWYAGGYPTVTAARLAGIRAVNPQVLHSLVNATNDLQPWLPDHF